MREPTVKNPGENHGRPTRRDLLRAIAAFGFGLATDATGAWAEPPTTQPGDLIGPPASRPALPWWTRIGDGRSRVVDVRSDDVLHASVVDRMVLGEMVDLGVQNIAKKRAPEDAWRTILGPAERIVVKFNSVGADIIKTNETVARVLVERLEAAGYAPERVALVEVSDYLREQLRTREAPRGWGETIRVGQTREALARYLYDADAIINVPFLKTHQIAGMSCSMKNLSHALLRRPARFHANGCSPFVGQVIGAVPVSSRLRLTIVNAIRIVVDHGPDAQPEDLVGYGGLLCGIDPVAVDTVGAAILATERRRRDLPYQIDVPYLASAARLGIGRWRPADIDRIALTTRG